MNSVSCMSCVNRCFQGVMCFIETLLKKIRLASFFSCFQDRWKQMLLIRLCFFDEDEPMRRTSVKKVDWVFKADY